MAPGLVSYSDGDEFPSHYATGDEARVFFLNVETKAVDAHTFAKQAENA
jgi:hypothetical protein